MTIDDPARPETPEAPPSERTPSTPSTPSARSTLPAQAETEETAETAETAEATAGADTTEAPSTPAPRQAGTWSALRPLVLRLHFYAGVLIAPFLLVAAASGLLYALSYQAEKVVYAHELEVPVGDATLPLSRQVDIAREANPDGTVTAVWPGAEPGATTRVLMADPDVPEDASLAVFVDPYTGD
ncbi:PepSY domain-containing protein, partial [Streptomyces sp. NPDC059556]|uniref:PepSY domain-containing protein n=1 Tax=Streptomyces sp. NPDC059556 TaxID=3346863 RepID=UPI0036AB869C